MAESVKKAKAPAKPRAAKSKATAETPKLTKAKRTVAEQVMATMPSHEEIAQLAQQYWAERGWQEGQAEADWLRAERELRKMAS